MKKAAAVLFFIVLLAGCTKPVTVISPPKKAVVRLLFGGDMMFDRSIRQKMQSNGNAYVFAPIHSFLSQFDLVVANLEGPVTSFPSKSVGSIVNSSDNYVFTFDPSVAQLLWDENIHAVNIGNNHIGNFGVEGIVQTEAYLKNANVSFFGNTNTTTDRTLLIPLQGLKVGFVNYNQFVSQALFDALQDIQAMRERADLVVVYTHWGSEYVSVASKGITEVAHQLVDAGADLVIGSHPHVVQQVEEYKGKKIYYSLGNFMFDQYLQPETQYGLLVSVDVSLPDKELKTKDIPIRLMVNGQTRLQP